MSRFEAKNAAEEFAQGGAPLLVGMTGPSGSGKTKSALRMATGIQSVVGGRIFLVDTEQRRALHYAKEFDFGWVDFKAPFGSLDYLDALRYCKDQGAGVVIIDSCSHEHSGPGGLLEQHQEEVKRMAGNDPAKRERVSIGAWAEPKAKQRKLISAITTELAMPTIFCFRAKTGTKPAPRGSENRNPIEMGYTAIGDEAWLFEMAVNFLFLPAAGGVPTWESNLPGERAAIKCPLPQFQFVRDHQGPVDESIGDRLARWSRGEAIDAAPGRFAAKEAKTQPPPRRAVQPKESPPTGELTDTVRSWCDMLELDTDQATDAEAFRDLFNGALKTPEWAALKAADPTEARRLRDKAQARIESLKAENSSVDEPV